MASETKSTYLDLYQNKSKLKWIVVAVSSLISIGSIYYTNIIVEQLKKRERQQIETFAKATAYVANETKLIDNINFITQQILLANNDIPLILVNDKGSIIGWRNIEIDPDWSDVRVDNYLKHELLEMKNVHEPIPIHNKDDAGRVFATQYVYYKNSWLLRQLIYYPYVQLSIIAVFGFIAYLAFNYSKASEQNRVWVGLAKETAHQLGTPISSLMAWVEYFKESVEFKDKGIVDELNKDIQKLQMITERFSNIGSAPVLKDENLQHLISNTVAYLRPRLSSKVTFHVDALHDNITAKANAPLFEWVVENICKNAVDAMTGAGTINVHILRGSDNKVFVDISDTGKGIPKSKVKQVFNPGFTTKKRGWGLGLTLVKRIVEIYHNGKIFVKSSEENTGTTFRIILNA